LLDLRSEVVHLSLIPRLSQRHDHHRQVCDARTCPSRCRCHTLHPSRQHHDDR